MKRSSGNGSGKTTAGNPSIDAAIIDTHCHLWHLELAEKNGLTADFGPIFRTFSAADFYDAASPLGVSTCVLIESGKTGEENEAMEKIAASSGVISAFTPFVDLASPRLEQDLDRWRDDPKFRGVRARFEGHSDPNILANPDVLRGIAALAERRLILEFLIRASHLKHILKIYERVPHLRAIAEHMAKPDLTTGTDRGQWQSGMKALATYTSMACKLSLSPRVEDLGKILSTPGKGWPVELIKPFVQSLLEWFGPDRLMWGSDWPIALLFASYGDTLLAMRAAIGNIQPQQEASIFRINAMEFYRLTAVSSGIADFTTREVHSR